ncbi:MAG: hypothetical protein LRY50_10690 [Geovibrio sp.]|nr:hypothetical protein [Geovibrio sp.]
MKKAILINSLTPGGAEKVASLLIKYLNKTENIEVICLEINNFFDIGDVKVTYLSENSGKENSILKILKLPFLALKLKRYIKKENIQDCPKPYIQSKLCKSACEKLFIKAHSYM